MGVAIALSIRVSQKVGGRLATDFLPFCTASGLVAQHHIDDEPVIVDLFQGDFVAVSIQTMGRTADDGSGHLVVRVEPDHGVLSPGFRVWIVDPDKLDATAVDRIQRAALLVACP